MRPGRRQPDWPARERLVIDEMDERTAPIVVDEVETVVAPPPRDPRGRWMADNIGLGMILILAALAIAAAIVAAILLTRDDNKNDATTTTVVTTSPVPTTPASAVPVAVASVVGQPATDASVALRRSGLRVVTRGVTGPPPAGRVLAQAPSPGQTVRRGGLVTLNVSNGSKRSAPSTPATTPPHTTAQATTAQATTTPATATTNGNANANASTTTTPATTTTAATTTTPQPTTVAVPSLSGQVKGAVQRLASSGLPASIQYVPGDDPLGTVTAQSPQGGTSTKQGSHVTISVSSGPGGNAMETVPDTTGQRIPDAVQTLNRSGLRLILLRRTVADRSQAGSVVDQTPGAGAHAPKNAQVVVYMGAYRGPR